MAVLQNEPALSAGHAASRRSSRGSSTHCLERARRTVSSRRAISAFALQSRARERAVGRRAAVSAVAARGPRHEASIAVLPFRNMSADADAEYFSDGMTEEIINALAGIEALRVAARTSAVRVQGQGHGHPADRPGARRAHGARRQRPPGRAAAAHHGAADRRRDGYHLWSERFDREMQDVFAVQDEIALAIAAALKVRLLPAQEDVARRAAERGTSRPTTGT